MPRGCAFVSKRYLVSIYGCGVESAGGAKFLKNEYEIQKSLNELALLCAVCSFCFRVFSTAAIFGESDLPLPEWLFVTIMYASVASASFGAFGKLERLWEREGKIPEITKLKYD